MIKVIFLFTLFLIPLFSFSQEQERITPNLKISNDFKDQFDQLDITLYYLYGSKSKGWRDSCLQPFSGLDNWNAQNVWGTWYFPYVEGGVTKRWQFQNGNNTPKITELNWARIIRLPRKSIDSLSPCEKADIYFGNKDFRITKHEMYWRGKLRGQGETRLLITSTESHEGFCNGARAAGAILPEPKNSVILKSLADTNIVITFFPLDIKMLATMSYFHMDANMNQMIGGVVNGTDYSVNAGTFDIALRSVIGSKGMAFFMDADPSPGVATNVSIIGYKRTKNYVSITQEEKAKYPNAYNKVTVNTIIYYLGEISESDAKNTTTEVIRNHSNYVDSLECRYDLYIENGTNNIMDGVWVNNSYVPDNIWFANGYGSDEVFSFASPISQPNKWDDNRQLRLGNPYLPGVFVYNLTYRSAGR